MTAHDATHHHPDALLFGLSARSYSRLTAAVTGGTSLILGVGTAQLGWLPWPWLWAAFYLLSAAASVWLFVRFPDAGAVAVAGAATIVAHFMRGAVLVYGWLTQLHGIREFTGWQILVGVTAWWTLSFASALLFFTRVAILASADRHGG